MSEFPIYQYVQYGAISLNDPELEDTLSEWYGQDDVLSFMPQDALRQMQEDNAYVIANKATGAIGIVTADSLVLNYEEPEEDETGFRAMGESLIAKIINKLQDIDTESESEDFIRGLVAATEVMLNIQEGNAHDND